MHLHLHSVLPVYQVDAGALSILIEERCSVEAENSRAGCYGT